MRNKIIWIGALVGLIIGFILFFNLNNQFVKMLLYLLSFPFIKFIPAIFGVSGGLLGLIIQKRRIKK